MENTTKKNPYVTIPLVLLSVYYCVIMYKYVFILDTNRQVGLLSAQENIKYFLPRIPLYFLISFLFIAYFLMCLWNIKKRTGYIGIGLVAISILACIRYNLPFYPRNWNPWREVWQNDVVEYLFPLTYLGMLISLMLLPAMNDALARFPYGKRILIAYMAFEALSIDFVSVISCIVMEREAELSVFFNTEYFGTMLIVKAGILCCMYKLVLNKEDLKVEKSERNRRRFILEWLVPIGVMLILLVMKVEFKGNYILIPRQAEIDGYWYVGSVEQFIAQYENPYQDRRVYLEVGAAEEEYTEEERDTVDLDYYPEEKLLTVITYERKLEGLYYMEQFSEEECESSNLHSFELKKRQEIDAGKKKSGKESRNYRAVLSEEIYENTVFTYCIKTKVKYDPTNWHKGFWWGNNFGISYTHEILRDIEEYDVLVQGKEIPAYFLGMIDTYGIVKVEPYTHFWGENEYECWPERWQGEVRKVQAARQY